MGNNSQRTKRVFLYHHQRIFWPLLTSIMAFLLAKNGLFAVFHFSNCAVPAFITYVSVGLFYDWLIFTYLGHKDSEKLTPEEWKLSTITKDQADKLNEFFVMTRKCSVAASVSSISICLLFFPQASLMGTFFFTYVGITIILIFAGTIRKEIAFKYATSIHFNKSDFPVHKDFMNLVSPIGYYNHTILDRKVDDSYNPLDPTSSAAHLPGGILYPVNDCQFPLSKGDSCNPLDPTSSAAHLPGGVLYTDH